MKQDCPRTVPLLADQTCYIKTGSKKARYCLNLLIRTVKLPHEYIKTVKGNTL